jgi:hypothetical protein
VKKDVSQNNVTACLSHVAVDIFLSPKPSFTAFERTSSGCDSGMTVEQQSASAVLVSCLHRLLQALPIVHYQQNVLQQDYPPPRLLQDCPLLLLHLIQAINKVLN